jgi:hypothetical protein
MSLLFFIASRFKALHWYNTTSLLGESVIETINCKEDRFAAVVAVSGLSSKYKDLYVLRYNISR